MSAQPDDLSLTARQVHAAQDGDAEALNALFGRYLPRVRAMVAHRLGKTARELQDVEDLVQETFEDAVRSIERFEQRSEGGFRSWLARCVETTLRDRLRHDRALKRGGGQVRRFVDLPNEFLAESVFEGAEPTPSQHARAAETDDRIERALLELGERHREVIHLRVYCEMSYREIAEAMELRSENTANVLFLRARDKLAQLLA